MHLRLFADQTPRTVGTRNRNRDPDPPDLAPAAVIHAADDAGRLDRGVLILPAARTATQVSFPMPSAGHLKADGGSGPQ